MRFLRDSSEPEMIAEFLRQEYASSERYGTTIARCLEANGAQFSLLTEPDLTNPNDNAVRRRILGCYRGYGEPRTSFFTDFPAEGVRWEWAAIDRDDLLSTHLIRYCAESWNSCRLPREIARMIRQGDVPDILREDGTMCRIETLATAVRNACPLPPLLLVSADEGKTRVAMEGNTRLIAYAVAEAAHPREMTVLIGYSPRIACWDEYR